MFLVRCHGFKPCILNKSNTSTPPSSPLSFYLSIFLLHFLRVPLFSTFPLPSLLPLRWRSMLGTATRSMRGEKTSSNLSQREATLRWCLGRHRWELQLLIVWIPSTSWGCRTGLSRECSGFESRSISTRWAGLVGGAYYYYIIVKVTLGNTKAFAVFLFINAVIGVIFKLCVHMYDTTLLRLLHFLHTHA